MTTDHTVPVVEPQHTAAAAGGGVTDVENQAAPPQQSAGISNILRRWRREDYYNKGALYLRGIAFVTSLLSFLIMACNQHGPGRDFDDYEEYRYALAIAILSTLYTGLQVFRQVRELSVFTRENLAMADFIGDQVVSYLLISAASSAVPLTNSLREGSDNIFTDSAASSIAMEFLAFFALALSAVISGYKLAHQTYI